MRPFEPTEYPLMWSGSAYGASRHRRTFYPFGGGGGPVAAKRQPTLYMVPMTPSKPAFLMKPTGVPPNSHQQAPFSSDYSRFFNCSNNLTSNSLMNSYATANRFERLPAINGCSNFQPALETSSRPWLMSGCACGGGGDEAYMDENARHARKLLNEIDIKSKMKKYDANELFNTEILDHLETRPANESYTANYDRAYERGLSGCGLHRSNSALPSRYSLKTQHKQQRSNHLYQDDVAYPNTYANKYAAESTSYLDDFRSFL